MNGTCSLADCGLSEGLTCELGHLELPQCPHFAKTDGKRLEAEASVNRVEGSSHRLPWTGRALGLNDMTLVSARSSPTLVGLIGPYNSGKTAFLTSLFIHFAKTGSVSSHLFAGSYSLRSWTQLQQYTVWPSAIGPNFPPHTPDSGERVPSLLHLAFRKEQNPIRDLLFTDAPGEWFTRWILDQNSENSQGAQWIAQNATHFLFFVDREALAGANVGKVRQQTQVLARVLAEQRRGRPVIAIWSKSDGECVPDVEEPIRKSLQSFFGNHLSFNTQVGDPRCLDVLESLLHKEPRTPYEYPRELMAKPTSPFLAYQIS